LIQESKGRHVDSLSARIGKAFVVALPLELVYLACFFVSYTQRRHIEDFGLYFCIQLPTIILGAPLNLAVTSVMYDIPNIPRFRGLSGTVVDAIDAALLFGGVIVNATWIQRYFTFRTLFAIAILIGGIEACLYWSPLSR
jgi:hypothetical protein